MTEYLPKRLNTEIAEAVKQELAWRLRPRRTHWRSLLTLPLWMFLDFLTEWWAHEKGQTK